MDEPSDTALADAPRALHHVARSEPGYDDRARDRARTRVIATASAVRDLGLPASADRLTDHEARTLVRAAQADSDDPGLAALGLSLVFGRPVERLRAAFETPPLALQEAGDGPPPREAWADGAGGALVLEIALDLPGFAIDLPRALARRLLTDKRERLRLGVPGRLRPEVMLSATARDCDAAMRGLRDRVARPYARGRIAGWLGAWLRDRGADVAVIGGLTGQDPGGRAQMHYTCIPRGVLLDAWEAALADELGLKLSPRARTNAALGSRARLPVPALAKTFGSLRGMIDADRDGDGDGPRPLERIAAAHDRYAIYALELLGFATGHRPVNAPFERLGDADLETGLLVVADKGPSGGRSERVVALPGAAVAQLRHWAAHVEALHAQVVWRVDGEVAARIAAAVRHGREGAPLFFFLSSDRAAGLAVVEPARAAMTARRRAVPPVQTNLARHVLRSHLVAEGAVPDAVDASLGHARLGEEPWGATSTLSIADLRGVAAAADRLVAELDLHPCSGPLA